MLNIQDYGSSSGEDSDDNEKFAHLKPISSEYSVANKIQVFTHFVSQF